MDDAIRTEVDARLDRIEEEEGVRILYACESGSRAWGFASTDSDYDVRFVYVHPRDWYLSIDTQRRDVIERPVDGPWDVNGWDLRKTLGLLARSNPPLFEWLTSPIVYRESGPIVSRLRDLMPTYYSAKSAHYHYVSMARGNYREYLKGDVVWRKKYFYLLRPLLACRWIERDLGPVPMEFDLLRKHVLDDPGVQSAIERLLAEKRAGTEQGRGPADPVLSAFIGAELKRLEGLPAPDMRPRAGHDALNDLFRAALA